MQQLSRGQRDYFKHTRLAYPRYLAAGLLGCVYVAMNWEKVYRYSYTKNYVKTDVLDLIENDPRKHRKNR